MNMVVSVLGLTFCSEGAMPWTAPTGIAVNVLAPTPISTILDELFLFYGICRQLASETAGVEPMCIPIIIPPWLIGSLTVKANLIPVLTWGSTAMCAIGGAIEILEPGCLVMVT